MSEWIRPKGCEGGACVEYRTVGDKVFVRNSSDRVGEEMLEFTVAEWEAFVGGLTAEADAKCQRMLELAGLRGTERDRLASENARLRQQRTDDLAQAAANAAAHLTEALSQRDAAIAEAVVLRHRDRRTQAVVDAAKAWLAHRRSPEAFTRQPRAELIRLADALDALQEGPASPPESTLPAEQPPGVAEAPNGLETLDNTDGRFVPTPRLCREQYPGGDPTARIVRCGLLSGHEGNHDEMIDGERGNYWPRKPDGEVPEAGRAGEAQTITETPEVSSAQQIIKRELWARLDEVMRPAGSMHETELSATTLGDWLGDRVYAALIDAGLEPVAAETQDRTEGLDAAIEAGDGSTRLDPTVEEAAQVARLAGFRQRGDGPPNARWEELLPSERAWCRAMVLAAYPLIERAALHAAADAWDVWDVRGVADDFSAWLRARATRTETS